MELLHFSFTSYTLLLPAVLHCLATIQSILPNTLRHHGDYDEHNLRSCHAGHLNMFERHASGMETPAICSILYKSVRAPSYSLDWAAPRVRLNPMGFRLAWGLYWGRVGLYIQNPDELDPIQFFKPSIDPTPIQTCILVVFIYMTPHATTLWCSVASTAILQFVILITWQCLTDTRSHLKNKLFDQFFTSISVLEDIASSAALQFDPGLLDVVNGAIPPTTEFFKTLPSHLSSCWGVYVIVLRKAEFRPKFYVGSGTHARRGITARLRTYDRGYPLSQWVQHAVEDGYKVVHKGVLCWIPIPAAAQVPIDRLLILALEGALAFIFWTMKRRIDDYSMSHICLWNRLMLGYDGLRTHCSLKEGILRDFHLTAEQLEAQAVEKEEKRLTLKAENATNHHSKQMAEYHDEYIGQATLRVYRSRARNPGRHR